MRKQIYTSKNLWNQIIIWLPLFLVPMMYAPHGVSLLQNGVLPYIVPLSMVIVGYLNYFVLSPLLLKGHKRSSGHSTRFSFWSCPSHSMNGSATQEVNSTS